MRAAALLVGAAGLACGGPPPDQRPVILWETGVVTPRFPVVPEAAWEPVHQRVRRQLEPGVSEEDLLPCWSLADEAAAVAFYAGVYGLEPEAMPWRPIPAEAWAAQERALALEVSLPLGDHAPAPAARRAELPQRGDLPALVLETPRLDAGTGEAVGGVLACLHWSQPAGER